MGGYGSGRPAVHVTCEQSLRLDMASPATRTALKPNACTSGSWHWTCNDEAVGAVGYLWSGFKRELTLRYARHQEPMLQTISLALSTPHFGGVRWWFRCPFTGARVRTLFLPPGAKLWGSRRAYELAYQSSRECGQERAMLRLLSRHGNWPGDPLLARVVLDARDPDPFGFREQRKWERREEARARRNQMRRIARCQRVGA